MLAGSLAATLACLGQLVHGGAVQVGAWEEACVLTAACVSPGACVLAVARVLAGSLAATGMPQEARRQRHRPGRGLGGGMCVSVGYGLLANFMASGSARRQLRYSGKAREGEVCSDRYVGWVMDYSAGAGKRAIEGAIEVGTGLARITKRIVQCFIVARSPFPTSCGALSELSTTQQAGAQHPLQPGLETVWQHGPSSVTALHRNNAGARRAPTMAMIHPSNTHPYLAAPAWPPPWAPRTPAPSCWRGTWAPQLRHTRRRTAAGCPPVRESGGGQGLGGSSESGRDQATRWWQRAG